MNTKLNFKEVKSDDDIRTVAALAQEIWHEHFIKIIEKKQIEYMLDKLQSFEPLKTAIADGYNYLLFEYVNEPVGYTAYKIEADRLFLSKLYLKHEYRGRRISSATIEKYVNICKENNLRAIYLTTNKKNPSADIYRSLGFKVIEDVMIEIGDGYFMDDYIMEKPV